MDGAVDPITHAKRSSCQSSSYGRSPSLPTTLVNKPVLLLNTPLSLSGVRPSGGCNSCRSDRLALPDMQFKCPSTVPRFLRSHSLTTTKFICHRTPSCKMRIIFLSRRKVHPSWELWGNHPGPETRELETDTYPFPSSIFCTAWPLQVQHR